MAYSSTTLENIHVVRWQTTEERDLRRIQSDVADLHKKMGRPCIYLALVPEDSETPSNQVRSAMIDSMAKMLEHCETIHFVIEGSGFKHTVLRSAMAGILLVAGRRGRIFVHTTAEEAVKHFPSSVRIDSGSLLRSLRTQQLIA